MNFKFLYCPLFFIVLAIDVDAWGLAEPVPETFLESREGELVPCGTTMQAAYPSEESWSKKINKMEKTGYGMISAGSLLLPVGSMMGFWMLSWYIVNEIGYMWCELDPEECELSASEKKFQYTLLSLGLTGIVGVG